MGTSIISPLSESLTNVEHPLPTPTPPLSTRCTGAESPPPRRLATRSPAPADTVLPAVAAAFERDQMLQLHQKPHAATVTAPTHLSLDEHLERNAKSFIISNAFIVCVVSLVIEIKACNLFQFQLRKNKKFPPKKKKKKKKKK